MIVAAPGGNLLVKCVRNTSGVVPKNHAFFYGRQLFAASLYASKDVNMYSCVS